MMTAGEGKVYGYSEERRPQVTTKYPNELVTVHMTPIPAEKQQTYYKSIDMDFVCSSFIHRRYTAQTYQTESIPDDQAIVKDVLPTKGTKKNTSEVITKVLYDVLPKVLRQALNDVLPKVLPQALNGILPKVMLAFLEKAIHQNLYNVHGTASNFAKIKDKTKEVDNKDSEAAKPDGHAPKVNECADKKGKPEEVDNKDSEAPKRDEHASKVD
ncbi:hypothetical protein LWI28_019347 [Acer negundo]|uniref:Uncharacterized protein n=1 Tax=Acer negundo TaxID=4023 RepID=A0AAD5J0M6_ACENE|nr:hypothetical protein LWI28_019347 [Acer negundo]